jgi:flagellar biosynthesis/type III secretory pathway protein FliH
MAEDFDLESLAYLEQTFFDAGYTEGHAHGRIHGLIEGRALGREKGFEMWEELGFYEGFAKGWRAILESRPVKGSESSTDIFATS